MSGTLTKSVRIPRTTLDEIEQRFRGRDFSSAANELLSEALKMRRCPGIVFAEGATGRRARVSGTGVDVWQVVAAYESVGRKLSRLADAYPALTESQIRAALGYYRCYPAEIDARLQIEDTWTPDQLRDRHPLTRGALDEVLPRRRPQPADRRDASKRRRGRD
jgi:uncharacterized protein (DUF433 family)